jgi:pimeloyl-ACP methyl ester carboxylesterase
MAEACRVRRRSVLALLGAASFARAAFGTAPLREGAAFDVVDVALDADRRFGKRCRLLVPRGDSRTPLPVLVLLHGLGETKHERLGLDAWPTAYGASRAIERLFAPPIAREREKLLSDVELEELNGALAAAPFSGLVLACPFMPNPWAFRGGPNVMFPRYARFLEQSVLPAVRERVKNADATRAGTGLAGVSLGGYAAVEVGLRAPALFATVGTVQGAYGPAQASEYARRLAELGPAAPRGAYVATSSFDPYRAANERLGRKLAEHGLPARLSVRRGAHSQGFLREIGTLELLVWHDRALRGNIATGETRPA